MRMPIEKSKGPWKKGKKSYEEKQNKQFKIGDDVWFDGAQCTIIGKINNEFLLQDPNTEQNFAVTKNNISHI